MRAVSISLSLAFAACGPPEPPSVASVSITPDVLYAGDMPYCAGVGWYSPDGLADQSRVTWFIGGMPVGVEPTLTEMIRGGDVLTCTVTPFDGEIAGASVSASVTVLNSEPSYTEAVIEPAVPVAGYPLSCRGVGWYDPDGDWEQLQVPQWTRDGIPAGAGTSYPGPTEAGHAYGCTIVPFDGEDEGQAVFDQVLVPLD